MSPYVGGDEPFGLDPDGYGASVPDLPADLAWQLEKTPTPLEVLTSRQVPDPSNVTGRHEGPAWREARLPDVVATDEGPLPSVPTTGLL